MSQNAVNPTGNTSESYSAPTSSLEKPPLTAKHNPRGTLIDLWKGFLQDLESEFGKETVDRWLRSLRCIQSDEKAIWLEAKDSFQALWFEEHIRPRLPHICLPRQGKKPIQIHLSIFGRKKQGDKTPLSSKDSSTSPFSKERKKKGLETSPHFRLEFPDLDPTATFDCFIDTPENEIIMKLIDEMCSYLTAKKIASLNRTGSIATWDSSKFMVPNPIYLWGPPGCGKSHLLQATTSRLQRAGLSVIMASSELFTEHVVKSIRAGEMSTFRSLWRNADVLVVDDIHLFARKSATQEEFFHTFNTLHTAGKQIILSSNCLPQQLQFIESRLVSRFEWGIVLPIEPLIKKHIPSVLTKKAALMNFPLSGKQIDTLFSLFPHNVKSSVRALEALILRTSLTHKDPHTLTPSAMKDMLQDLIAEEEKSALTPQKIISIVADHAGIPYEEITGKSQSRESVIPRQLAMFLIRKHLKIPYMKIGDIFARDHSTVMSSIRQIEKQISNHESDIGASLATIEVLFSEIS